MMEPDVKAYLFEHADALLRLSNVLYAVHLGLHNISLCDCDKQTWW